MWPDRPLEVKVAGKLNIVYIYRTLNNVPLPHCNDLTAHRTYYVDLAGFENRWMSLVTLIKFPF